MQIMTADNISANRESILYKGPSGSGKTPNAFSWPTPIKAAYFDKNQKNVKKMMLDGLDAELYVFDDWEEFNREFVSKVLHREFEAETIVVDTWDFAAAMLMRDTQGGKIRMAQSDWGTILSKLRTSLADLTSATLHLDGEEGTRPSYNIVCTTHQMDVTNDDGALLRRVPKIPGQFKDEMESYFDTVLICESKVSAITRSKPGGGTERVPVEELVCYSTPPTPYDTCKGAGLPPKVGGTHTELILAWEKKEK